MKNIKWIEKYAIVLVSMVCIASYLRLYLGVDVTDESFYAALPYRFILGSRPIIDEYSICQFAAILLYPFYKIFFSINHSTDGVILFARHLYMLFNLLLGGLTYVTFKNEVGKGGALLIATIPILYVPFNIQGLSYNTLAIFCFTTAALLTFLYSEQKTAHNSYLKMGGLFYALAVFSYPPFAIPVAVAMVMAAFVLGYKRVFSNFILGALPVIIILSLIVFNYQTEVLNIYYNLKEIGYGNKNTSQLPALFKSWLGSIYYWGLFVFLLLGILLQTIRSFFTKNSMNENASPWSRYIEMWCYGSLVLLPIMLLIIYLTEYSLGGNLQVWHPLFINFSLLAPIYMRFTDHPHFAKRLVMIMWLPSVIAGSVTAFASSNGFLNAMVGLLPAFLATVILIYLTLINLFSTFKFFKIKNAVVGSMIALTTVTAVLGTLIYYKFAFIYREANYSQMDSQITEGPYKFLYTTSKKAIALKALSSDLHDIIGKNHPANIAVYPSSAGFYLLTALKPMTSSLWLTPNSNNHLALEYWRLNSKPDLVVVVNNMIVSPQDALVEFFNSADYTKFIDRGLYSIYLKSSVGRP
ncbi:MAG: hypothetical protein H0U71_00005 [Gammaproteobacteria bacterium]|nr:hypothetical protein [Gammaproteobacteria bacterium]